MPNCYKCNARITFVELMVGFRPVRFTGRLPIDIDPDPNGSIVLFSYPGFLPGLPRRSANPKIPQTIVGRRLTPTEIQVRGGSLYRVHFDTCPGRR